MALPAHVLARLPPEFLRHAVGANQLDSALSASLGSAAGGPEAGILALPGLEEVLPDGGLPRGAVVELSLDHAAAMGTTFSLAACRAAQAETRALGGESAWCSFIDPSSTLHGPGVACAGVELERLLVVRPTVEALGRVALRVVESNAFAVVVIDTVGSAACPLNVPLGPWARIVRRLSMALAGTRTTVLLLTDREALKPLTLPVAQRLELQRKSERELVVTVSKDRRGLTQGPRSVPVRCLMPGPGLRRTNGSSISAQAAAQVAVAKGVAAAEGAVARGGAGAEKEAIGA